MSKTSAEYAKEWKIKNPEKHKANVKRYAEKNKDKLSKKSLEYYYKNKDKVIVKNKERYLKNIDKKRKESSEYHKNHLATCRLRNRKSYYKARSQRIEYAKKYRLQNKQVILDYRAKSDYYLKEKIRKQTRHMINSIRGLFVCNECGSDIDVQVHHFDYVDGDFTFLCKICHSKLHRKEGVDLA